MQTQIELSVRTAQFVSRNELCWKLAEEREEIGEGLNASWYSGFARALDGLEERGRIRRTERKLLNFDEVCRWFPYKTRLAAIRDLRLALLPVVATLVNREFDSADNERFHLERLRKERPNFWGKVITKWRQLERGTITMVSETDDLGPVVLLLAKGRELFLNDAVYADASLHELISALPQPLDAAKADLGRFYARVLPEPTMTGLSLKSEIYSLVEFGRRVAKPRLKEDTKLQLLKLRRDVVANLPGHCDPPSKAKGASDFEDFVGHLDGPRFSDVLDTLLDRHVLEPFEFLEPV